MKEKLKEIVTNFFTDFWAAILWGVILVVVMMGVLWISSKLHIFEDMPTSESLIITFIGILATFVVVSNFSQVANIEQQTNSKIEKMENEIISFSESCLNTDNEKSLSAQLLNMQANIEELKDGGKLKSPLEIKNEVKEEMLEKLKDEIDKGKKASIDEVSIRSLQMLKFANALINSKQKDMLQKLLLDNNALFKVTHIIKNGNTKTNNAQIQIKDGAIQFISETGKTTFDKVIKIDGVKYNPEEIEMALIFVLEAMKKTGIYERPISNNEVVEDDQI